MKVILPVTAIIFFQLISFIGSAQNNALKFNLVENSNGKPLGKIRNMTQDLHGCMWFAGEGAKCIYRYDGNRFTIFRHNESDPNSLGGTNINSIYADNTGMIWVGSGEGLDQLDPATGISKHYRHMQTDPESIGGAATPIIKDRQGRLWVGTDNGLDRMDEKTGKFIHYRNQPENPKSISSNVIWSIYEDRQGVIWVGTGLPWFKKDPEDGGLNRLNTDGTFTRYMHNPNDPHSLINNKVAAIFEDSRGTFWVGTSGDGLHTMDRKTGKFERHLYDPKAPGQLSRPPLNADINDKITFINEDSAGAIWIGTMYSGINRYDNSTKKITHYKGSNGFPDSTTWNAFTSRDGELWITTERDNLYRTDPFHRSVNTISTGKVATGFMEDRDGYLWVATHGNGLLKFDQHYSLLKQYKHNPSDPFSISNNDVHGLYQDQKDSIWVGTSGLQVFNTVAQQFSRFNDNGNVKDSVHAGVSNIFRDKHGTFWFTRWGLGLIRYDPADHSFKHFRRDPKDPASLSSDSLGHIVEDTSGILWIAGAGGINRLNRESGRFKNYLEGTWVSSLYQDSGGNLWAGTSMGLYRYDPAQDRFSAFFDPQQEINSMSVGGITEDNAKNLWMASQIGIIKLNPFTKETFVYGSKFEKDQNDLILWGVNAYKNREGHIFIPGDNAFYTFSPEELAVNINFKILITDLFMNTVSVLPGKGSPIQRPVDDISDLDLRYNQNNIGFNFTAIDYRQPEAVKYFFMLEGYDREWQEVKDKKEKSCYYFNLAKGKYVFRVKAFNSDGTKAEKAITIYINPPWWQTVWAYAIYVLLLAAAFFVFYRYQKQRIIRIERQKRQEFELAQAKEIEKAYTELKATQAQLIQSEKMASLGELTAGIAHEIQNPLNFVNNFSEVNKELLQEMKDEIDKGNIEEVKAIVNDLIDNEEKINHHGKRADAIVKGMLQHSRSSTGIKEPTDINALADEYLRLSYHGLRAKDKSFNATLKTDLDESIGNINIIPQDIGRVLLNLFNNAFYAVDEKKKQQAEGYEPTVLLSTKKAGKTVSISVKDNGNGIPKKIVDKIFQPFFTTKPTGQGTGLGLSLSYDIIKAHGGEIKVETNEGDGSSFIIQLPIASTDN